MIAEKHKPAKRGIILPYVSIGIRCHGAGKSGMRIYFLNFYSFIFLIEKEIFSSG